MAIVRWEPARSRYAAQGDLTRLFTSLFDSPTPAPSLGARRWSPPTDLVERENDYLLELDLPGLSEQDVRIELKDDVLTISGERRSEHEDGRTGYYRIERAFGAFRRTLTVPEGVDPQAITATFDRGVLQVVVPKPEERKPQTIEISVGGRTPAQVEA